MTTTSKAAIATREYLAFISYRHADNKQQGRQWATWLHQALETYEVPADLVGKANSRGEVIPERIYPIFRDEDELPAHADLANSITSALTNSRLLVVLCSPNAVASTYVADEIRFFKQLGHSDRIIAAMIDGEPNASWDNAKQAAGVPPEMECFPLPLQFNVDEQGELTTQRAEPIAADFRVNLDGKTEQGWTNVEALRLHLKITTNLTEPQIKATVSGYQQQQQLMLLKIIAGILGVPLGELTKRDQAYQLEQQRKKAKRLRQWLSGVAVLAILATGAGVYAWQQRNIAIVQRDKTEILINRVRDNIKFMSTDMHDVLTMYVPIDERVNIMYQIDSLSNILLKKTSEKDYVKRSDYISSLKIIAKGLIQKADIILDYSYSNEEDIVISLKKAVSIYREINELEPGDISNMILTASALERIGDEYRRLGEYAEMTSCYNEALIVRNEILGYDRTHSDHIYDVSLSHYKLAVGYLHARDIKSTDIHNGLALKFIKELKGNDPDNSRYNFLAGSIHKNIGETYFLHGDEKSAIHEIELSKLLLETSVRSNSEINSILQLSSVHETLGNYYLKMHNYEDALHEFKEGKSLAQELRDSKKNNHMHQVRVALFEMKIIRLFFDAEDFTKALKMMQSYTDEAEHFFEMDPHNKKKQEILHNGYIHLAEIISKEQGNQRAADYLMGRINYLGMNGNSYGGSHFSNFKMDIRNVKMIGIYYYWSWYSLLSKNYQSVSDELRRVLVFLEENVQVDSYSYKLIKKNIAHAELFLNNYDDAKTTYSELKGYKYPNGKMADDDILNDLKMFRKDFGDNPNYSRMALELFGRDL
ncbi:MAG: TIR domain-containing protein [Chromatiaceae bacterium]|jgi:tetratricopeptide (TPR) repeat protein